MDAPKSTFGLLRRELEEILAMLTDGASEEARTEQQPHSSPAQIEPEPQPPSECAASKPESESTELDELFEDALEVVTEFGEASPAILQMWLSIDYNRAARLLLQLEAAGLVSPNGKVLHKAHERLEQG